MINALVISGQAAKVTQDLLLLQDVINLASVMVKSPQIFVEEYTPSCLTPGKDNLREISTICHYDPAFQPIHVFELIAGSGLAFVAAEYMKDGMKIGEIIDVVKETNQMDQSESCGMKEPDLTSILADVRQQNSAAKVLQAIFTINEVEELKCSTFCFNLNEDNMLEGAAILALFVLSDKASLFHVKMVEIICNQVKAKKSVGILDFICRQAFVVIEKSDLQGNFSISIDKSQRARTQSGRGSQQN